MPSTLDSFDQSELGDYIESELGERGFIETVPGNTMYLITFIDKYFLRRGEFSLIILASITTTFSSPLGVATDGTDTIRIGDAGSGLKYLKTSGIYSDTILDSSPVDSTSPVDQPNAIEWDSSGELFWGGFYQRTSTAEQDLVRQSGFTTTILQVLDVYNGADPNTVEGIATDDTNTIWQNDNRTVGITQPHYLQLQSGKITSTILQQVDVVSIDTGFQEMRGISYNGVDTPWCYYRPHPSAGGFRQGRAVLTSGQFTLTILASRIISTGVSTSPILPKNLSHDNVSNRLGI